MRLLTRLALFIVVGGLVAGLLLRRGVSARRLPVLLALGALPWLLHVAYVLGQTREATADLRVQAVVFAGSSLLAAGIAYWLTRRMMRRRLDAATLFPVLLGLLYGPAPLLWFHYELRGAGVVLDSIPNIWLYGSLIFEAAAFLSFTLGRDTTGRWRALPNPFRRDR